MSPRTGGDRTMATTDRHRSPACRPRRRPLDFHTDTTTQREDTYVTSGVCQRHGRPCLSAHGNDTLDQQQEHMTSYTGHVNGQRVEGLASSIFFKITNLYLIYCHRILVQHSCR